MLIPEYFHLLFFTKKREYQEDVFYLESLSNTNWHERGSLQLDPVTELITTKVLTLLLTFQRREESFIKKETRLYIFTRVSMVLIFTLGFRSLLPLLTYCPSLRHSLLTKVFLTTVLVTFSLENMKILSLMVSSLRSVTVCLLKLLLKLSIFEWKYLDSLCNIVYWKDEIEYYYVTEKDTNFSNIESF